MALLCGRCDTDIIKLVGCWHSDDMMHQGEMIQDIVSVKKFATQIACTYFVPFEPLTNLKNFYQ